MKALTFTRRVSRRLERPVNGLSRAAASWRIVEVQNRRPIIPEKKLFQSSRRQNFGLTMEGFLVLGCII